MDRNEGLNALNNVIEKIRTEIEQRRGIFKIKMEPKVVTDVDDAALRVNSSCFPIRIHLNFHHFKEAMLDAEMENVERPGDDSADSDENEG